MTISDPFTRLRKRYEDLKDLIFDLRVDIAYLTDQCDRYERLLKEHPLVSASKHGVVQNSRIPAIMPTSLFEALFSIPS